ncbi:MAG: glycosyltransferase family 9 protein [Candidatus Firestonebacteria bacterium]
MKKILIINLGGVGDMLFSVPFLRGLRAKYKKDEITLFTVVNSCKIIANQRYFDKVVEIPAGSGDIRRLSALKYLKVLLALRKERYDLVVNLRTVVSFFSALKVVIILFIIRAEKTAGKGNALVRFIYDYAVAEKTEYKKHEIDYHAELAEKIGFKAVGKSSIKLDRSNLSFASKFLSKNKINSKNKLIVVNHEARWQTRRWPLSGYIKLFDKLLKKKDVKIAVNCDKDIASELIIKKIFKKVVIIKTNDIRNLAAVIKRASLLLSNDTGVLHMGAAQNIKTLGLYGSTDPFLTAPYLPVERKRELYKHLPCSPCNKMTCSSRACFKEITAEEVYSAIIKLLGVR